MRRGVEVSQMSVIEGSYKKAKEKLHHDGYRGSEAM
jgi:hypothetical protein